jgi:plastocyanin
MADRQLRTRIIRALGGGVVVAALVGGTALAADQAVAISGFAFGPASVTVSVGDTVTWTNNDAQTHTATADDASWDAGNIAGGGGTKSVTFATAGTFPYHCAIHPAMTGSVTVTAAAPAPTAGATTPPTDAAPISETGGGSEDSPLVGLLMVAAAGVVALRATWRRLATAR